MRRRLISFILIISAVTGLASCKGAPKEPDVTTAPTTAAPTTTQTTLPAVPERTPTTLGKMSMGTLFYKPAQAAAVYNVKTAGMSAPQIAALRCLQGLVARNDAAAIYLEADKNDSFWREYAVSEYGMYFKELAFNELFTQYKDMVKSFVVYDQKKAYEYPIAQTLASTENGIAVDTVIYERLKPILSANLKKTVISDLCKDATSAINWATDNLLPKCEKQYAGTVSIDSEINDYLYATKSFCLSINASDSKQLESFRTCLAKGYQKPGIVMGSGADLTAAVSPSGFGYINCKGFGNATFFSSFPGYSKNFSQPASVDKKAMPGKIYASICITDDNKLNSSKAYMNGLIDGPVRGSTPVNIAINPALAELAPPILNWYHKNRNSSSLFIGSSWGYSQIDQSKFESATIPSWLATNSLFLKQSGINILTISGDTLPEPLKNISAFQSEGYLCTGLNASKVKQNKPFISVRTIKNLDEKNKNFKLTTTDAPQFLCFNISVSELGDSPYTKIDSLVKSYQEANPNSVEFLLAGDLCKTFLEYEKIKDTLTTTAAPTTTGATTQTKK